MAKKNKNAVKRNLRQVRFNVFTDTGEQVAQRHSWTFFILNNHLETARILFMLMTMKNLQKEKFQMILE
jgi:hypothetical protein